MSHMDNISVDCTDISGCALDSEQPFLFSIEREIITIIELVG